MGDLSDNWDVVNSEKVLDTGFLQVYKDKTLCKRTSTEAYFYHFETYDWVNIIAVTPDDKIVMIEQFRHGVQKVLYEVPGGCIDPDDTDPVAAGVRELLEETGYAGERAVLIGSVYPNPALQNNRCYTVLIENVKKIAEPRMDDMEDINTFLLPADELNSWISDGKLNHGLVLNAVNFYQLYKQ